MSTPSQIAENAAVVRRRALILAVVILLVVAMGAGWYLGRSTPAPTPTSPPDTDDVTSPIPEAAKSFVPEAGEQRILGRYPAGFTRTPEGAVSAAVHAVQSWGTNDVEALAAAGSVYYGTDISAEMIEADLWPMRAQGIEMTVPEGEFFDPTLFPARGSYHYITLTGVSWEVDPEDEDLVHVVVLAEEEISDGMGLVFERSYIHGRQMQWDLQVREGDWVIAGLTDPVHEELYDFDPDEYDLEHEAWTPLPGNERDQGE